MKIRYVVASLAVMFACSILAASLFSNAERAPFKLDSNGNLRPAGGARRVNHRWGRSMPVNILVEFGASMSRQSKADALADLERGRELLKKYSPLEATPVSTEFVPAPKSAPSVPIERASRAASVDPTATPLSPAQLLQTPEMQRKAEMLRQGFQSGLLEVVSEQRPVPEPNVATGKIDAKTRSVFRKRLQNLPPVSTPTLPIQAPSE